MILKEVCREYDMFYFETDGGYWGIYNRDTDFARDFIALFTQETDARDFIKFMTTR